MLTSLTLGNAVIQVLPPSAKQLLICAFRGNRFSLGQYHPHLSYLSYLSYLSIRVGILGDLLLLVDPSVVANVAIVPLAVSILSTGSLSSAGSLPLQPADFLSSAEQFLLPAFHSCTGASLFPLPSAWSISFDLAGFLSSAELFLLPVSVCPYFVGPFGFVGAFVDSAAIVLPALSLSSVELPSSTDVALFPVDISSSELPLSIGAIYCDVPWLFARKAESLIARLLKLIRSGLAGS